MNASSLSHCAAMEQDGGGGLLFPRQPALARVLVILMLSVSSALAQLPLAELPLPELSFEDEEEAPATEYLVEKPSDYLMLPTWQDADRTAMDLGQPVNLGGGLWPGQEALLPEIATSFRPRPGRPSGMRRAQDSRIVIAGAERTSPQGIPAAYLPYYFDAPPKHHLADVQRLLPESEWQYTDWYLTYHGNECQFKLSVLLFSPEEQIPESVSGQRLLDDWFPAQDHVLAFYFHGRPERVQLFFPRILTDHFPESDFEENLLESVDSATRAGSAGAQLDEFCQKLGTWLVWWEKRLKVSRPNLARAGGRARPTGEAATAMGSLASGPATDATAGRGLGSMAWGLIGLAALAAGGVLVWLVSAIVNRRRRPVAFPRRRMVPRLGAPHSGGGGVVLTFGSRNA